MGELKCVCTVTEERPLLCDAEEKQKKGGDRAAFIQLAECYVGLKLVHVSSDIGYGPAALKGSRWFQLRRLSKLDSPALPSYRSREDADPTSGVRDPGDLLLHPPNRKCDYPGCLR